MGLGRSGQLGAPVRSHKPERTPRYMVCLRCRFLQAFGTTCGANLWIKNCAEFRGRLMSWKILRVGQAFQPDGATSGPTTATQTAPSDPTELEPRSTTRPAPRHD